MGSWGNIVPNDQIYYNNDNRSAYIYQLSYLIYTVSMMFLLVATAFEYSVFKYQYE